MRTALLPCGEGGEQKYQNSYPHALWIVIVVVELKGVNLCFCHLQIAANMT